MNNVFKDIDSSHDDFTSVFYGKPTSSVSAICARVCFHFIIRHLFTLEGCENEILGKPFTKIGYYNMIVKSLANRDENEAANRERKTAL